MGRIVAISSGDLASTRPLNIHAIELSGKTNPHILFIGTASGDAEGYIENITREYSSLGCELRPLCIATKIYSEDEINSLLSWADVIYVGGGDTISMMQAWKQHGLDSKLKEIYEKDSAVLTGISAGAICWFSCGHSDSASFQNQNEWNYCWAENMLDLFHMAFCPHYDEEGRKSFDLMLKEKEMLGLAMESDTAFVENNGKQYYVRSSESAKAYILQYNKDKLSKNEVSFAQTLLSNSL